MDILRKWKPGNEFSDERMELLTVWNWLEAKAKEEEKTCHQMPINPAGIRLTLTYMRWVLDEKEEITSRDLRIEARATLDDYLKWDMSEMAEFTRHEEDVKIKDRLNRHFSLVEKKLVEGIKSNSQVAIQNWMKATGNYIGEKEQGAGYKVIRIRESYKEEPLPEEKSEYQQTVNPVVSTPSQ